MKPHANNTNNQDKLEQLFISKETVQATKKLNNKISRMYTLIITINILSLRT